MSNPAEGATDRVIDVLNFWDYFQTFVEEENVSIVLHSCHQEICDVYEAALLGEMPGYEYFITNMPRRTGKTKILEALASWMAGEFGDAQMLYGSYSDKLVMRTLAYVQRVLQRPWYIDLYGDIVHTRRADLVTTTEGGTLYGAGTSATITGFGAGLKEPAGGFVALDDPAKPDEALSKVSSENVIQNFETTWKGCRNSDLFTPIIINAQRLGPADLPGYVFDTYRNKTFLLKFPCMVSGVSVFPETWSTSTLHDLQKTRLGRFVLASQFQQDPIALGGNLIQTDSFRRYDSSTSFQWESRIITCDTAMKAEQHNDWSVLQLWGLLNKNAYLIDQARGQWESPELLAMAKAFHAKHHHREFFISRFTVEAKAAGIGLVQQLQRLGIPAEGIERTKDKVTRVQEILPYIETGMVHIPRDSDAPWVPGFLTECAQFKSNGTAPHDDQVDSMCDGIWMLLGGAPSILDVLGAPPASHRR